MDAAFQRFTLQSGSANTQIVIVPGILAYSQDQAEPLMQVFAGHDATVVGLNYNGTHFDAERCTKALSQLILRNLADGRKTVLFASSLGGMLTAKALTDLRTHYSVSELNHAISTIIVDSPASGNDLILLPFLPTGINSGAGKAFSHFQPHQRANKTYGKLLLNSFRVPPKDAEIELTDGGPTAEDIKQRAIKGLSGHPFTVWYDQVRWMLNTTLDLSKLDGLDITYVACTANNVTVRQPQARQAWEPHVSRVMEVATPHCAYLQAQPTWTKALASLIASMLPSR